MKVRKPAYKALMLASSVLSMAPLMRAQQYPTFVVSNSPASLSSTYYGDIDGVSVIAKDGTYHFIHSFNNYNATDVGQEYIKTSTAANLGELNSSGTTVTYDSRYANAGTVCYQLDKSTAAIPSIYEDDHCDVAGVWVDPTDGTWYAIISDEYDFAPFTTSSSETVVQRVSTGNHGNRTLSAKSTDKGQTWQIVGVVQSNSWNGTGQAITAAEYPGTTYSKGGSGPRLFVDNATGYFYVYYGTAFGKKSNGGVLLYWSEVVRAPISGKMATGTWNKYYNGAWTEPGVGGQDQPVAEVYPLSGSYTPSTDTLTFNGTGIDGTTLNYASKFGWTTLTFKDASGNTYTASSVAATSTTAQQYVITNASGTTVSSVTYYDPALGADTVIATTAGTLASGSTAAVASTFTIAQTYRTTGMTASGSLTTIPFVEANTGRIFFPMQKISGNFNTYNVYSNKYQMVGYNHYNFQSSDLGVPDSWQVVGVEPSVSIKYLGGIDYGSLTNARVSSFSYRTIGDLNGIQRDFSMVTTGSGTYSPARVPTQDVNGTSISSSKTYTITIGGSPLRSDSVNATAAQWVIEPVVDSYNTSVASGFYKLKNVYSGLYAYVAGTQQARLSIGALLNWNPQQTNFDATGNSGQGAHGGSDQWYFEPIGKDTPATLSSSSSSAVKTAAGTTSLAGIHSYKLVNRNSDLPVGIVSGTAKTQGNLFGSTAQTVVITPIN